MPTINLDFASISTQLTAMFKQCMETARDSVKAVADNEHILALQAKDSDIEGLRAQILGTYSAPRLPRSAMQQATVALASCPTLLYTLSKPGC